MWTRENRGLYECKGVRYPSDLRDEEWTFVEPLIPPARRGGPDTGLGCLTGPYGRCAVALTPRKES